MKIEICVSFAKLEFVGRGDDYGEALANLYNVLSTALDDEWIEDYRGFVELQLEDLEHIDVPWAGEIHPLPDVHRFLLEEARQIAELLGTLRADGTGPLDAAHTVERERQNIRSRSVAVVLERDGLEAAGGEDDEV